MGTYRISRNCEASLTEHIKEQLVLASFTNINVEKTFARIYDINLPSICIRISDTTHDKAEVGSNSTIRSALILIDIFATSTGLALDLKDFLVSILKNGAIYYEYVITNGSIQSKTQNGRIRIEDLTDTEVNLNIDRNNLDVHDRYRWLITANLLTNKIET